MRLVLRTLISHFQARYEITYAPWIAIHVPFIFIPLHGYFKKNEFVFLWQVADGTGHIVSDVDNFLRRCYAGELPSSCRYIFLRKSSSLSKGFIEIFRSHFFYAKANTFLYYIALPMLLAFPDLTVDCGLSRLKISLKHDGDNVKLQCQITKIEGYKQWVNYYALRSKTSEYLPLLEGNWENDGLREFIGGRKFVLVHIKSGVMNATAAITEPESYLPAIFSLLNMGYAVMQIGGEAMPDCFKRAGVIDYSRSSVANFANDIRIIKMAEICLMSGSGIAWIADLMNIPLVYLNYWHLFTPPYSRFCICVPTTVVDHAGKELSFSEQIQLYMDAEDVGAEVFPLNSHTPFNASADEILEAVIEVLSIKAGEYNVSNRQLKFKSLDTHGWLTYAESNVSDNFLVNHIDLLENSRQLSY